MFLKNQQVTGEIKRETKKLLETNDSENTIQSLWDAAKAVLRRNLQQYNPTSKTRKTLTRQPNLMPKTTGKRTKTTPKKLPKLVEGKKL